MDLRSAKGKLHDTTPLIGRFRQRAAIKALAASSEPWAAALLAETLVKGHRHAPLMRDALAGFSSPEDQARIDEIWRAWADGRSEELAGLLGERRWPCGLTRLRELSLLKRGRPQELASDVETLRRLLELLEDSDGDVVRSVLGYISGLPKTEALHDEIFTAWCKTESEELERLIREQDRLPGDSALEALFLLVTGQPQRYAELGDDDGALFRQAFVMASGARRQRINETVLHSGDRGLVAAYRAATASHDDFDSELYLKALKTAGNEDGLFDAARNIRLADVLGLCEHWSQSPARPTQATRKAAVDRAVTAFRALGEIKIEEAPSPPEGLVDIFEYWEGQSPSDDELRADLEAEDPFERARGLMLGHQRGLVDRSKIEQAAGSEHWPERFVVRLADPTLARSAEPDHVQWISLFGAEEAGPLGAPVGATPDEYERNAQRLQEARGAGNTVATQVAHLLEILCAFQGAFVASEIVVDEHDDATDRTAAEVEDAEDVEF